MALRALEEALAEEAARADRDLRLGDVIAGAERIALGIEEDQHPLALVIVEEAERDRRRPRPAPPAPPTNSRSGTPARNITVTPPSTTIIAVPRSGWTRISAGGNADQQRGRPDRAPAADLARRQQRVEMRAGEHDHRLHQLGRLQVDEAEIEPALGAAADEAERLDDDQHAAARSHRPGRRAA